MPEYVVKVEADEVLSTFELEMLAARVKNFFTAGEENPRVRVKAEYL